MNIKRFFKQVSVTVVDAVKRAYFFVFSDDALKRATKTAERIVALSERVLPIVRTIALLTPSQADDAIVALAGKLQVKLKTYIGMSDEEKNAALKASAVALARKTYPNLKDIDDATLYAAIDLAYRLFRDLGVEESLDLPEV